MRSGWAARASLGLLLGAAPSGGADEAAETCLACHSDKDLTLPLKSGETLVLGIDPQAWGLSVHGAAGISCTDCHSDISDYPHPELKDRSRRDVTLRFYTSCRQCHEDQYDRALDSVHQRALAAGNRAAAVCTDCHDPHAQTRLTDPDTGKPMPEKRVGIPRTCARCHERINADYARSVHGAALAGDGNPDVPTCIDCHGVHDISDPLTARFRLASPGLCAGCHTNAARMAKYGLSTLVLKTYVADFHGTTVTLFRKQHPDQQTNKPVCYDCHGVHDIRRTRDPEKGIHVKENLLRTCRKCHPDATAAFPEAWLSHYIPSRERNPLVYWVNLFYRILIPSVVGSMLAFVATDFARRRIDKRRKEPRT